MRLHRLSAVWVLGMGLGACAGERPQFGTSRPSGDASDATASDDAAVDTTVFDETNSDSTTAGDDTGTTSADSTAASTSDGTDTNSSDEDSRTDELTSGGMDTTSGAGTSTDTDSTSEDLTSDDEDTTSSDSGDSTNEDSSQTDSTDTGPGTDDAGMDAECGNGTVEGTEACDDGNPDDGDGCTACVVDPGWTCTSEPSQCEPPAPPVITSFAISTDQLPGGGGEVTLSWAVTGADTVRIEAEGADDIGEVTGQLISISVDRSTTFTLIAENAGGKEERTRAVEVTSKGTQAWYLEFGTTASDQAHAIATDAEGNVFVVGDTSGSLGGDNQGGVDTFVSKYTAAKELKWHRQLGTEQSDYGRAVATDANGAVFIAGQSFGDLQGGAASLGTLFLAKYTDDEQPIWVRQFGEGQPHDVAVAPNGDIYVAGVDRPGPRHLTKYSNDGVFGWTEVVEPRYDSLTLRVAADAAGDVFLIGYGYQRDGSGDWFLSKYRDRAALWSDGFAITSTGPQFVDSALSMSGELILLSYNRGAFFRDEAPSDAETDMFLTRYSTDSDELGTTQLGADYDQLPTAMAVDASDNVLVVGSGTLSRTGTDPLFIGKYNIEGELQWASQLSGSQATGVATARNGMVFVSGTTEDFSDAFIAAFR